MNSWVEGLEAEERENRLENIRDRYTGSGDALGNDPLFTLWLDEVDATLFSRVGLGHLEMTDYLWNDAYASDVSPVEAVNDFLDSEMDALMSALESL